MSTPSTTLPLASLRRPAWERLPGTGKAVKPSSAGEGYRSLGEFDVELVPIYTNDGTEALDGDSLTVVPGRKAIRRVDTGRIFNIVSNRYSVITPGAFAELLDDHLYGPLEVFAHLRGGQRQLAVYAMPEYEVRGDPMTSHLIFINDCSGSYAMRAMIGSYRGLCTNGQVFMSANGVGRIIHNQRLEESASSWLGYIREAAIAKAAVMRDVYEVLADSHIPGELEPMSILARVYPMPKDPDTFGPRAEVEHREQEYERKKAQILTLRGEALALYQGAGTGLDHPACAGTAWGLLQAIMELEEYRPGRLVAESNLIGERQEIKARAYNVICSAIGMN